MENRTAFVKSYPDRLVISLDVQSDAPSQIEVGIRDALVVLRSLRERMGKAATGITMPQHRDGAVLAAFGCARPAKALRLAVEVLRQMGYFVRSKDGDHPN